MPLFKCMLEVNKLMKEFTNSGLISLFQAFTVGSEGEGRSEENGERAKVFYFLFQN